MENALPNPLPNAQWVAIPGNTDPRGSLGFLEAGHHVPFAIKRIFYLYDVTTARGAHAHRTLSQFFIVLNGSLSLSLDDGLGNTITVTLNNPRRGLNVGPYVWCDLTNFTPGTVCLVLASDVYDEADYLRDYPTFIKEAAHHAN